MQSKIASSGSGGGFVLLAIIIANGNLDAIDQTVLQEQHGDLLIAADGGATHCLAMGLMPDIVVGDFDSLSKKDLARLRAQGVQFERHPARKDFTDLELALYTAVKRGAAEVLIFAGLGDRWDMNLANLMLLANPEFTSASLELIAGSQRVRLVRPGQPLQMQGTPGDTLSLVPLCGNVSGVTTTGLEYSLKDEQLAFGATRGVSNVLVDTQIRVELSQGELLCIHIQHVHD